MLMPALSRLSRLLVYAVVTFVLAWEARRARQQAIPLFGAHLGIIAEEVRE